MPSKLEQLQLRFRQRIDEQNEKIGSVALSPSGLPRLVVNGKGASSQVMTVTNETSVTEVHSATTTTVHQKTNRPAISNSLTNGNQTGIAVAQRQRTRLPSSSSTGSSASSSTGNHSLKPTLTTNKGKLEEPKVTARKLPTSSTRPSTIKQATASHTSKIGSTSRIKPSEGTSGITRNGTKETSGTKTTDVSSTKPKAPISRVSRVSTDAKTPNSSLTARSRSAPVKAATNSTINRTTPSAPKNSSPGNIAKQPASTNGGIAKAASAQATKISTPKKQTGTPSRVSPTASKSQSNGHLASPTKASEECLDPNMAKCHVCGRNFLKERIEKHTTICEKTSAKRKKVFDSTKMRVKGTEAEQYLKKGSPASATKQEVKPKKTAWRTQHENFLAAIREAKRVQQHLAAGGKLSDLPPPPPTENPDYVPCPYCGRKFNEGAAERHIPKCKNIVSNKKTKK